VSALQTIFRYWLWLLAAAVLLLIALAGYGAFDVSDKVSAGGVDEEAFDDSFGLHAGVGYLVILGGLVTVVLALVARVGRAAILHSLAIFGLMVLQLFLAWTGADLPGLLGALHPVNAVVIFFAVVTLAVRMGRFEPATVEARPAA
jgi:hypothetical protein